MDKRSRLRDEFLKIANWAPSKIDHLQQDASFRKYFRISKNNTTAILMDAPPERITSTESFLEIANWLIVNNLKAPEIYISDLDRGFVLMEDLGDMSFSNTILQNSSYETESKLYSRAIDVLVHILNCEPIKEPSYDLPAFTEEISYFLDWYLELVNLNLDEKTKLEFQEIWSETLNKISTKRQVTVLRDYHIDNLMWLPENKNLKAIGLLDFQDAVLGHAAYDLVSLLEDVRREISRDFQEDMLKYYLYKSEYPDKEEFKKSYSILGAQRNTKILGVFARLALRDKKHKYLSFLPRTWRYLAQDLECDELSSLKLWFNNNIPTEIRSTIPNISRP